MGKPLRLLLIGSFLINFICFSFASTGWLTSKLSTSLMTANVPLACCSNGNYENCDSCCDAAGRHDPCCGVLNPQIPQNNSQDICAANWKNIPTSTLFTRQKGDFAPFVAECTQNSITVCLYVGGIDGSFMHSDYVSSATDKLNCNYGQGLEFYEGNVICRVGK